MHAFMLPAGAGRAGQRLAIWHEPPGSAPLLGLVLYVHPFGEELNKTRRMAALQARALAAAGFGVLQLDLAGCGDSSGEFADATWADWLADVHTALDWLADQPAAAEGQPLPLTLWGLRAGCLVLSEAARQRADRDPGTTRMPLNLLFWQPTPSGAGVLRQFLRTAAAAAILDGGGKGVVEALRAQLATGRRVDVGGYVTDPALAAGLEQALLLPAPGLQRVAWFEVRSVTVDASAAGGSTLPALSPALLQALAPWQDAASWVQARVVTGPPFWQTTEIETAPALIEASTALLTSWATSPAIAP